MLNSSFLGSSLSTTTFSHKSTTTHKHNPIIISLNRPTPPPQNPNPNFITTLSKFLWGPSLPPQLLISTVRSTWSTTWQIMMSQLAPSDPSGSYTRPTSQFRAKPSNRFSRQNLKSLHLYVGLPCPWAHRTLIVRALKGLQDSIPVSIASPGLDGSWIFLDSDGRNKDELVPGSDNVNGCRSLREVYKLRAGGYSGRSTVPMLWDVDKKDVVCNESYDIIELLNASFSHIALNPDLDLSPPELKKDIDKWNAIIYPNVNNGVYRLNLLWSNPDLDLSPPELKKDIDKWNAIIYPNVNNGVYRCGFAQSQEAYDKAVNELFDALDLIDDHLATSRYLCGDKLTLSDVCLFTTLIRFDIVYNVLFKCTKKKLVECPNLYGYMRDIYQIPEVATTCNLEAVMDGYYKFLFPLNPGNIRPIMPGGCEHDALLKPHNRESLSVPEGVQVYIT